MSDDLDDEWVDHWTGRPHGPKMYRSAAHTLIVDAADALRNDCDDLAMDRLRIAADLLTKANDAEAGVYDDE